MSRILKRVLKTTATPKQVWDAWTRADILAGWFVDKAELDPRPGGRIKWIFEKMGKLELPGEFLEVDPERRVTWTWPPPPGHPPGIMEITIERTDGVTTMTMVHSGFSEDASFDDEYEGMQSGWDLSLAVLKHYLERQFGRPKDSFMALRPAVYEFAQLAPFFLEPARLSDWLTRSGRIGSEGGRADLTLVDGSRVTGEVLAVSRREVAMAWPEVNGVLELKAFSGRAGRMLGVRVSGWDWPPDRAAELERALTPAVERLAALFAPA